MGPEVTTTAVETTTSQASESQSNDSSAQAVDSHQPERESEPHPIASKDPVTKRHQKAAKDFAAEELAKLEAQKTQPERKNPVVSEKIDMDGTQAQTDAPKYEPNYKVKVLDKEHEIPEAFRGLIKDAESEKQVREVFEKALGLEPVKQQRDQFKNQVKQFQTEVMPELQSYRSQISEARDAYQKGDMHGFFKKLNVAPEKVLQYALDLVQYQEMNPEQRRAIDTAREAQERAQELEKQNQELSSQFMTQAQQAKALELDTALARAEIKSISESYDQRPGRNPEDPSFRDIVIDYAEWIWDKTQGKTVLSADQAIQEVIRRYGLAGLTAANTPAQATMPVATQSPGHQPAQPQVTPPQPKAAAQPQVPVIPNVSGRSTSPTKAKPKSLEDLRKLREQMA
jgi:hypothetical protein